MDSILISTLIGTGIGAIAALVGSFGAVYLAQRLARRQEEKWKYQEKIEEMQELAIQVNLWVDYENHKWYLVGEYNANENDFTNTLPCPVARLAMLAERYVPSLNQSISEIRKAIHNIERIPINAFEQSREISDCMDEIKSYFLKLRASNETMDLLFKQANQQFSEWVLDKPPSLKTINANHSNNR